MLEIKDIYKTFNAGTINERKALQGVSLKLEDGDFVTVIGGNGAGKSTMLNAVAGVWPVDSGSIIIDDVDVTGMPRIPGSYERNCSYDADRRKPRYGVQKRKAPYFKVGHKKRRKGKIL